MIWQCFLSLYGNIDSEYEIDTVSFAGVPMKGVEMMRYLEYAANLVQKDEYKTVFLCFPNWYSDMQMAVYCFHTGIHKERCAGKERKVLFFLYQH